MKHAIKKTKSHDVFSKLKKIKENVEASRISYSKSSQAKILKPTHSNSPENSENSKQLKHASHKTLHKEKNHNIPIKVSSHTHHSKIHAQKKAFDVNLASNATSGVQYREPFRSRQWKQRFSNITETILENDGYQLVQRIDNQNLVNGVAPPRLSNPLEVYLFLC